MNLSKLLALVFVTLLIAILLATALNGFTHFTDSALAEITRTGDPSGRPNDNAPRALTTKNYLPIIFLNSATAGGAWLLAGNAGTDPANDFIGTTDAQPLVFRTNNTEALRVDPAGRVGIGTISPTTGIKLEVNGLTRLTPGGSGGLMQIGTPNGETGISIISTTERADLRFDGTLLKLVVGSGGGAPPMANGIAIDTSGNVGIGTSSYSLSQLTVRRNTAVGNYALVLEDSTGSPMFEVNDLGQIYLRGLSAADNTVHVCKNTFGYLAGCNSATEYVPSIDGGLGFPDTADVVSIAPTITNPYDDTHAPFVVTKANKPCDDNLLGFIVNPASGADGKKLNEHYLPLAIYGYFPAKVTIENGIIHRGDALTSSSQAGYAMKISDPRSGASGTTDACKIIGYALEDANADGTIQVFANHGESAASEVASLRSQVKELKEQNATLDARLTALEQAQPQGVLWQNNWLIGIGLMIGGFVMGRRKRA